MSLDRVPVIPALFLLCFLTGCSDRDVRNGTVERKAEHLVDDGAVTASVKGKLASDVRLSTLMSINVQARNGIVTLTGRVPTAEDKAKAAVAASAVSGVKKVVNDLEVSP